MKKQKKLKKNKTELFLNELKNSISRVYGKPTPESLAEALRIISIFSTSLFGNLLRIQFHKQEWAGMCENYASLSKEEIFNQLCKELQLNPSEFRPEGTVLQ